LLAVAIQHQVDRHAAALTHPDRDLLEDLGIVGPAAVDPVAVDLGGPGPRLASLQHQRPTSEGKPKQVGQPRARLGVAGHHERRRLHHGYWLLIRSGRSCSSAGDIDDRLTATVLSFLAA
jgi:hypothetical protein